MAISATAAGRVKARDRDRASSIADWASSLSPPCTALERRGRRAMPMATATRPKGSW